MSMAKKPVNWNIKNTAVRSITPSGYFGNSKDQIVEIENFVTKEELDFLSEFSRTNTVYDITESHWSEDGVCLYDHNVWENRVFSYPTMIEHRPDVSEVLKKMYNRIRPILEDFYNVKISYTMPCLVRWPEGTRQEPHADKEFHEGPEAGRPNDFPYYDLSTVIYLNDDYEGGELYFPLQGVEFKPKIGNAYFFPGDMNYIHGVRPVISGCRYTSPLFWTIHELGERNE